MMTRTPCCMRRSQDGLQCENDAKYKINLPMPGDRFLTIPGFSVCADHLDLAAELLSFLTPRAEFYKAKIIESATKDVVAD